MDNAKKILNKKLIDQNRFWSYNMREDTQVPDDILIEKTLLYLDIEDINKLFMIYPYKKIKQVWRERLVVQGDYFWEVEQIACLDVFWYKKP